MGQTVARVHGLRHRTQRAILLVSRAQGWWAVLAVGAVPSEAVIVTARRDAKAGTAVNLIMLIATDQ